MTTINSMSDVAPGTREARMHALPIPPYSGKSLPRIDYDAHPAYGGLFPKATLRERIHALNVFLRTFAFVTIRRIVDYDNGWETINLDGPPTHEHEIHDMLHVEG